jgi:hypothetical protein
VSVPIAKDDTLIPALPEARCRWLTSDVVVPAYAGACRGAVSVGVVVRSRCAQYPTIQNWVPHGPMPRTFVGVMRMTNPAGGLGIGGNDTPGPMYR